MKVWICKYLKICCDNTWRSWFSFENKWIGEIHVPFLQNYLKEKYPDPFSYNIPHIFSSFQYEISMSFNDTLKTILILLTIYKAEKYQKNTSNFEHIWIMWNNLAHLIDVIEIRWRKIDFKMIIKWSLRWMNIFTARNRKIFLFDFFLPSLWLKIMNNYYRITLKWFSK
jgi:hypothetical protein